MIFNHIIEAVLLLVSIYCLIKAVSFVYIYYAYEKSTGVVKKAISERVGNSIKFRYKIEVKDKSGEEHSLLTKAFEQPYSLQTDQVISVLYKATDKNKNFILSFRDFWVIILALLSIHIGTLNVLVEEYTNDLPFVKDSDIVMSVLTLFIGLFFLVKAHLEFIKTKKLKANGIVRIGRITDFHEEKDHDKIPYLVPEIEFIDENGNKHKIISGVSLNNPKKVGEIIEILSDKNYPEFAEINSISALWGGVVAFSFFSLVCFVFSILSYVYII